MEEEKEKHTEITGRADGDLIPFVSFHLSIHPERHSILTT
jgi:hypothetical protein